LGEKRFVSDPVKGVIAYESKTILKLKITKIGSLESESRRTRSYSDQGKMERLKR
jgi:hypothetical protein